MVGKISAGGSLNISSKYANYRNLTVSNFLVSIISGSTSVNFSSYGHSSNGATAGGSAITLQYTASSGVLSASANLNNYQWIVGMSAGNFNVYVIEGSIITA